MALIPSLAVFVYVLESFGIGYAFLTLIFVEFSYCFLVIAAAARRVQCNYSFLKLKIIQAAFVVAVAVAVNQVVENYWSSIKWPVLSLLNMLCIAFGFALFGLVRLKELSQLKAPATYVNAT